MPDPIVFKIQKPGHNPASILSVVRHTLDDLDHLGLGDALPDLRTKLAHAATLDADHRAAPGQLDQVRDDLTARLIADVIDPDAARAQMSAAELAARKDSETFEMMRRAVQGAAAATLAALVEMGDTLVTDLLRPIVDDAVATIVSSATALPATVVDDSTALAAGGKVRDTWTRLVAAHERWDDTHALADRLRRSGALSCPPGVRVTAAPAPTTDQTLNPIVFRFRHPSRITRPEPGRHPALVLADDAAAGAGPGLLIGSDVDLRQLEQEYTDAQPVTA